MAAFTGISGVLIMNDFDINDFIKGIGHADHEAMRLAAERQAALAKPPKSLGKLEDISIRIAGITGKVLNDIDNCRVIVFAADNGVVAEGVAVTPQSVTLQQSINMTKHKTGMSALAKYFGNSVYVVDVGINSSVEHPLIINRKQRMGSGNIRRGPAMTPAEARYAMSAGIEAAETAAHDGVQLIGIGEMGIGNTTTSAAVLSAITGADANTVTGRGSGLTDSAFELKKRVITEAIKLNKPNPSDIIDVISKVGGFDIAAMTGAFLGCARYRIPAVVDGFISIVAALCAVKLCPAVKDYLLLSHASQEVGYRVAAEELGLSPFLLLDMRLGEGSGCPLAFEIIKGACAVMSDMYTFDEASIDDEYLDAIRSK